MEQFMDDYLVARQRPVGVTLLAILALIGAFLLTIITGLAAVAVARGDDRVREVGEVMAKLGIPLPVLAAGILFLVILAWASGIGMWIGTRWGWHCGAFWYAYAIIRNLNALLTVYGSSDAFAAESSAISYRGPEYYYVKHASRLIVSFLIYLYFFKSNVREYFGLADNSRWKAAAVHFSICIGLFIVGSALSFAFG
jgi:hypothetical protein